jgi:hypothetical protein
VAAVDGSDLRLEVVLMLTGGAEVIAEIVPHCVHHIVHAA